MRVPVYERSETERVPSGRVSTGVPDSDGGAVAIEAGSRAWANGLSALAAGVASAVEARDKARAASAANDFADWNARYLHDEHEGRLRTQGTETFDLAEAGRHRYDYELRKRRSGLSGRQRALFDESVAPLVRSSMVSLMDHEWRGAEGVKEAAAEAAVARALDDVALDWGSDVVFEEASGRAAGVIEERFWHQGAEVVAGKVRDFVSRAHASRLGPMMEQDVRAARAYFEEHKSELNAEALAETEEALGRKEEVVWLQEESARVAARFGSEREAVAWVRRNYEGEKENRLVQSVKMAFAERRLRDEERSAAAGVSQRALKEELYAGIVTGRHYPSGAELVELLDEGRISSEHYRSLVWLMGNVSKRQSFEGRARRELEGEGLSAQEAAARQEALVRRYAGVSDAVHEQMLEELGSGYLAGEVDDETLSEAYAAGYVGAQDVRNIKRAASAFNDQQKQFLNEVRGELNEFVKELEDSGAFVNGRAARDVFWKGVYQLDHRDEDFRVRVRELARDAQLKALESTDSLVNRLMGFEWRSRYGDVYEELKGQEFEGEMYENPDVSGVYLRRGQAAPRAADAAAEERRAALERVRSAFGARADELLAQ